MKRCLFVILLGLVACGGRISQVQTPQPIAARAPFGASAAVPLGTASYELTITGPNSYSRTLNAPGAMVSCVVGRSPAGSPVIANPADVLTFMWEPDATQVCTWVGPTASTLNFVTGASYTATVVAIGDSGLRSEASPASPPFSLATAPLRPMNVRVSKSGSP